jgi:hypothetical protein
MWHALELSAATPPPTSFAAATPPPTSFAKSDMVMKLKLRAPSRPKRFACDQRHQERDETPQ